MGDRDRDAPGLGGVKEYVVFEDPCWKLLRPSRGTQGSSWVVGVREDLLGCLDWRWWPNLP